MRAIIHPRYGSPDVLALAEIERPSPGPGDVLVRVHAAHATRGDHHIVTGKPYALRLSPYGGVPRPKHRVPGMAMAGHVEAVGAAVTGFRAGDEVFGEARHGAFAEYVVVPPDRIAAKPRNLTFEEAAALPWAVTALQGLRDVGRLERGQRVLINGASGAVGTWAVQIGKALGAEVTAVCSTRNLELVRGLGADEVIDYTAHDFVTGGARFDVMFDLVCNRSLSDCRRVLRPRGTYVAAGGRGGDWFGPLRRIVAMLVSSLFTRKRQKMLMASPNQRDLVFLKELVEAGAARPVIEHRYGLGEVGAAVAHVGRGHGRGQTIIRIAG